jgi:release factor glutamine methyltransferase
VLEKLRVAQALEHGRQALLNRSTTPNLDAQLLVMKAADQTRAWVLAHPEAELGATQARQFQHDLAELAAGTALPYLLGWWEFYGRRFRLNRKVLIPRPETELLVEQALNWLQRVEGGRVLDLGTGSGCLAVTLAAEQPSVRVLASDIERGALQLARLNASWYGVEERISFVQADLLSPLRGPFDVICANLPYIPTAALADLEVARREPARALDGGRDGLSLIRRALEDLPGALAAGGLALFEIQPDQAAAVSEAARRVLPGGQVQVRQDVAGLERLVMLSRGV